MGFLFEEIFHFAKTTEFSLKGGWGTVMVVKLPTGLAPDPTELADNCCVCVQIKRDIIVSDIHYITRFNIVPTEIFI